MTYVRAAGADLRIRSVKLRGKSVSRPGSQKFRANLACFVFGYDRISPVGRLPGRSVPFLSFPARHLFLRHTAALANSLSPATASIVSVRLVQGSIVRAIFTVQRRRTAARWSAKFAGKLRQLSSGRVPRSDAVDRKRNAAVS